MNPTLEEVHIHDGTKSLYYSNPDHVTLFKPNHLPLWQIYALNKLNSLKTLKLSWINVALNLMSNNDRQLKHSLLSTKSFLQKIKKI